MNAFPSPEEIAKADDHHQIRAFLREASARQIQEFLHHIRLEPNSQGYRLGVAALNIRLAEDAEKSTRRIVKLTWWLVGLTVGLLLLTFALLYLTVAAYKDAHFDAQRQNAEKHHQLQTPEPPESKP